MSTPLAPRLVDMPPDILLIIKKSIPIKSQFLLCKSHPRFASILWDKRLNTYAKLGKYALSPHLLAEKICDIRDKDLLVDLFRNNYRYYIILDYIVSYCWKKIT